MRKNNPFASLTETQRQQILRWLDIMPYWKVTQLVGEPPPTGFGFKTSPAALCRFRQNALLEDLLAEPDQLATQIPAFTQTIDNQDAIEDAALALLRRSLLYAAAEPPKNPLDLVRLCSMVLQLKNLRHQERKLRILEGKLARPSDANSNLSHPEPAPAQDPPEFKAPIQNVVQPSDTKPSDPPACHAVPSPVLPLPKVETLDESGRPSDPQSIANEDTSPRPVLRTAFDEGGSPAEVGGPRAPILHSVFRDDSSVVPLAKVEASRRGREFSYLHSQFRSRSTNSRFFPSKAPVIPHIPQKN